MTAFPFRVLLVDCCRDNCDSMKALFRLEGSDAHSAYDVATALAMARDIAPDVVIAEVSPIDGCALARRLRAEQELCTSNRRLVIVAYSGSADERDRLRALASGFDRYFVKPKFSELRSALAGLVGGSNQG